jgi:selenocysteine-specific elongation factor
VKRFLVGTAGHIDHGKSALVRALTGTDPDRLPEEKARGITIDLGFAHAIWDDTVFSFVDVPGHEKFVKTMVAGAQGIDIVLLAVASDDSVMPQTREHFAILKLLGIGAGVIARTKSDLVDDEMGALIDEEIRDLVKGSFLEGAPLVPVSALTGAGLPALRSALGSAASRVVRGDRDARVTRLAIDRAFTMKGFGPVVTGTLDGGRIAAEDRLTLFPSGKEVRVRRVEVHGVERRAAFAGERTSLNLAGVERADLARGQTLVARDALAPSSILTAEVHLLPSLSAPLPANSRVRVHHGTADVGARLVRVPPPASGSPGRALRPGDLATAQLFLERPLAARPGDRFILRRPSPVETLGGGRILDTGLGRIRRTAPGKGGDVEAVLQVLRTGDEAQRAALLLREAGPAGLTAVRLGQRLGVPLPAAEAHLETLRSSGRALRIAHGLYAHSSTADAMARHAASLFAERKKSGAASLSFSRSEFLERLGRGLSPAAAEGWLATLQASKALSLEGDRVCEPGRGGGDLSADAASFASKIGESYRAAGFEPPKAMDLAKAVGTKPAVIDGLVSHLVKTGILIRVSPDLIVHRETIDGVTRKLDSVKGQTLTVAGFRDLFGLTRKNLIPLLEHLDSRKRTRRVGDARIVE